MHVQYKYDNNNYYLADVLPRYPMRDYTEAWRRREKWNFLRISTMKSTILAFRAFPCEIWYRFPPALTPFWPFFGGGLGFSDFYIFPIFFRFFFWKYLIFWLKTWYFYKTFKSKSEKTVKKLNFTKFYSKITVLKLRGVFLSAIYRKLAHWRQNAQKLKFIFFQRFSRFFLFFSLIFVDFLLISVIFHWISPISLLN